MTFKQLFKKDMDTFYNAEELAVTGKLTPSEGEPYLIDGIFDESEQSVDVGINVVSTNPVFNVPAYKIRGTLTNHDVITINEKEYRVKDFEPDGAGCIDILLSIIEDD